MRPAYALISPELAPFRAIWNQWDDQKDRSGRQLYLEAEMVLKQALVERRERDVAEFARSGDQERYAAALRTALNIVGQRDCAANKPPGTDG